jgi:hypothetical protein
MEKDQCQSGSHDCIMMLLQLRVGKGDTIRSNIGKNGIVVLDR